MSEEENTGFNMRHTNEPDNDIYHPTVKSSFLKPGQSMTDYNMNPEWSPETPGFSNGNKPLGSLQDFVNNRKKESKQFNGEIFSGTPDSNTGMNPVPGYSQKNFDYETLLQADKVKKVLKSGALDKVIKQEKFSKLSPFQKFLDTTKIGKIAKYALIGTVGIGLIGSGVGIVSAFSLPGFAAAGIAGKALTVGAMALKGFAYPMIAASTYGPLNVLAIGAAQLAGSVMLFKSVFKKQEPIVFDQAASDKKLNKAIEIYEKEEKEKLHKENIKKYGKNYESSPQYKSYLKKYASYNSSLEEIPGEAEILAGLAVNEPEVKKPAIQEKSSEVNFKKEPQKDIVDNQEDEINPVSNTVKNDILKQINKLRSQSEAEMNSSKPISKP